MFENSKKVKSAAATCVATLSTRYPLLVTSVEVEGLFTLSLRQINLCVNNDEVISSFSTLLANVSSAVLDPSITLGPSMAKFRKPSKDDLLNYLKMSFITGEIF